MNLGERIAAWRKHRKLTQEEVADEIGIGRTAVTNWETGDADPSVKHLDALIALLANDHSTFYGRIPKRKAA